MKRVFHDYIRWALLLFIIELTITFKGFAQENPIIYGTDGPYVFYNADSIEVLSIVRKDSSFTSLAKFFHTTQKEKISIDCNFDKHPNGIFKQD